MPRCHSQNSQGLKLASLMLRLFEWLQILYCVVDPVAALSNHFQELVAANCCFGIVEVFHLLSHAS